MNTRTYRVAASLFLVFVLAGVSTPARDPDADSVPTPGDFGGITFDRPPLRFEVNEGQTDPEVRFTARGGEGISFLTSDGAVFQITRPVTGPETGAFESSFVRLKTVGANSNPRVTGLERLPGVTNYFIGNNPEEWRTNVTGYAKVRYEDVYPGIDLVYYDNGEGVLEYDFIVASGADPNQIALSIEGAQSVKIDPSGNLAIHAATGHLQHAAPRIYQDINGVRQKISGKYRITAEGRRVTFALGDYDRSHPLVIDPQVIYATYLGGSSTSTIANEGARAVAVDAQGAVYITGDTISSDFPTRTPLQAAKFGFSNVFITKLNATGQMVYSTYFGGSGYDSPTAIKVDETGAVYFGGSTSSFDFPTVNPIQGRGNRTDAFVTKLNPAGSQIVYSTFLGKEDIESITDLAIDTQKNVYVVGSITPNLGVSANDFPTVSPIQANYGGGSRDGFMSVINPSGSSLLFSTYLGGNGDDFLQSVALVPSTGYAALGFSSDSSNFPSSSASVVAHANGVGPGLLKTVVLGILNGFIDGLAAYERFSASPDTDTEIEFRRGELKEFFNIVNDVFQASQLQTPPAKGVQAQTLGGLDIRLDVLDQKLSITKTTFFGGSGEDTARAMTTDTGGAAYIIGRTRSTNLPTVNPVQSSHSGGNAFDGFLVVIDPQTLEPVFATYLGGTGMESLTDVTVDAQGNIYVVGETFGNFPSTTTGAIQNQLRGRTDAFIIKISPAIAQTPAPPPGPAPTNTTPYTLTNRGGVSLRTEGLGGSVGTGYARIQPNSGNGTPSGLAIFGFRPGGILVTEAAVPASGLLQSGRIYAEVNGPVNTGLAIANPNDQPATITFNFTDAAGQAFGSGTTTIGANSQIAAFLDQEPFNGGASVNGTFNFSSNVPISVVTLRGFTNQRSEFLITTLPVVNLASPVPTGETIFFPHFAEGGGWTTQVLLVNPTDTPLSGDIQFFTPTGSAATLTIDGVARSTRPYTIAPRSSHRLQSSGLGGLQGGSIRIVATANNPTPSGLVVFTFKPGQFTVAESGVPALRTGSAFRVYAEASGNFNASAIGSIETGIAIANPSSNTTNVTFELTRLDGSSTGLTGNLSVPANGQTALFMNQIAGFSSMGNPAAPFQGVLRISSASPIAVVGLRGRYNERHDFLISTTAPVDESRAAATTELFFPHLADSGGYTTQFVLFSGSAGQSAAGTLRLLSNTGLPFNLSLR